MMVDLREREREREFFRFQFSFQGKGNNVVPFTFFNFLLITKIIINFFFFLKKAKLNGSSNWYLTEYYVDKNWNLEDWNDKT